MNNTYEALRALLRNKELEIKKLEKEIEALRIVLPIVAEAGESSMESGHSFESPRSVPEAPKQKAPLAGPDFDSVMAQVKSNQPNPVAGSQPRPVAVPDAPKSRTSWP